MGCGRAGARQVARADAGGARADRCKIDRRRRPMSRRVLSNCLDEARRHCGLRARSKRFGATRHRRLHPVGCRVGKPSGLVVAVLPGCRLGATSLESNGRLPVAVRAPAGGRGRPGGGGPRREGLLRRAPRRRDVAIAGARADNRVGPRLRVAGEDLDRRGDGELRPALAGRGAARVHGERLRHRGPAHRHERARHLAGRVRARAPRGRRAEIRGPGPRRLPGDGPGRAHGRGRGLLGRRRRRRGRVRAALGRFTPHRRGDDGHRLPDGRRAGRRSASDDYVRPATEKSRRSP